MRLAIVAASSYEENGQVAPIPNAEIDVELFGRRLAEPDAGFIVHAFDAQRGLPEGVEELARSWGGRASGRQMAIEGHSNVNRTMPGHEREGVETRVRGGGGRREGGGEVARGRWRNEWEG